MPSRFSTFNDNIMGTASLLDAVRQDAVGVSACRGRNKRQGLPEQRVGLGLSRRRAPGGLRSLQRIEGGSRDRHPVDDQPPFFRKPGMAARWRPGGPATSSGVGDWAEVPACCPTLPGRLARGEPLTRAQPPLHPTLAARAGASQRLSRPGSGAGREPGRRPSSLELRPRSRGRTAGIEAIADLFVAAWGRGAVWRLAEAPIDAPKEANFLAVDTALARRELGWRPRWRVAEAVARTAAWYRNAAEGADCATLLDRDIDAFLSPEGPGL